VAHGGRTHGEPMLVRSVSDRGVGGGLDETPGGMWRRCGSPSHRMTSAKEHNRFVSCPCAHQTPASKVARETSTVRLLRVLPFTSKPAWPTAQPSLDLCDTRMNRNRRTIEIGQWRGAPGPLVALPGGAGGTVDGVAVRLKRHQWSQHAPQLDTQRRHRPQHGPPPPLAPVHTQSGGSLRTD
jgi:hypothetical protein